MTRGYVRCEKCAEFLWGGIGFWVMRYAVAFMVFALALGWAAAVNRGAARGLLWAAVAFAVVALGYAGLGARVFGKRANGRRAWWARVLLMPYMAFAWTVWSLRRWVVRDEPANEIAPGVWLGRRPYLNELPMGTTCVVDLACEFAAARGVAARGAYVCLPVLDTRVPPADALVEAVKRVAGCSGGVYVHCAAGHGRSAMFVAALLLARGLARSPQEAVELIRKSRPGIRLSGEQERLLEEVRERVVATR